MIGDPTDGGLARSLTTAFAGLGWDVKLISGEPEGPSWLKRLGYRSRACAQVVAPRNLGQASQHADLVLCVKGVFVSPHVIRQLRLLYSCPIVCWNPDDPFDSALSNRGGLLQLSIPSYDLYVTWSEDVAGKLERVARSVLVLPFAWDPSRFFPDRFSDCTHDEQALLSEARDRPVFVGTWTREREQWLSSIRDLHPIVFGNRWPRRRGVETRPALGGRALRLALGRSAVSLNFLRHQNEHTHNMRTFEIAGCGGRQVAQASREHLDIAGSLGRMRTFRTEGELRDAVAIRSDDWQATNAEWLASNTYAMRVSKLLNHLSI